MTPARAIVMVGMVAVAVAARADIAVTQVGFSDGDDWEPAIAVDGPYVYVAWAHIGAPQPDSSGVACKTSGVTSYAYFQRSTNGGATWEPYILPRCPVVGTQIDLQVVVGPNHRVYVSYMDGPQENTNIELIYSDDRGTTWSSPVNVASGGGGDKDILLVEPGGGVLVGYEHARSSYVAYSPDPATTAFSHIKVRPPSGAGNGTSLATGATRDSHGNTYIVWTDVTNNSKRDSYLWLARSRDHFATYTTSLIDRPYAADVDVGAGWDYWGAAVQIAAIPRASNDRLVVVYNAGTSTGVAQRIYTKYSDTLGESWNIPYSASAYPNGTELSTAALGAWHGFPAIAATAVGVKVIWQDNRARHPCTSSIVVGACGLFNNYTRTSADGVTWTSEVKTQLPTTHPYQVATPAPGGFYHPYGDYTSMSTDGTTTWAIWGEGTSYNGPGTIYTMRF